MNQKVWVTRIVIAAVKGDEPFEMIVSNDCLTFQFVWHAINDYFNKKGGDRKILTVLDNWNYPETMDAGYYEICVADVKIGAITLAQEKMHCIYGARIIHKEIRYKATLKLGSTPYSWQNIISVSQDNNPSTIMRKAVADSGMRCIPDESAMWLKMAAKHIPDDSYCGEIIFAGVKIGDFKIEECHG